MSDKVVGIHGFEPPTAEGAQESVIAQLKWMLAEAESGAIVAFASIIIRPNLEIGTVVRNPKGHRHLMLAGVAYMMHDMCEEKTT